MGAAHTTGATGDEWNQQPTDEEQTGWRRIQTGCTMIQRLSTDVDAQYHCYQPYLLLTDIVHLYRTCHLWRHWIGSPGSVAHRSQGHAARYRSYIATVRNSSQLFHLSHSLWIQGYLYGCRISPPMDDQSNSWVTQLDDESTYAYDFFKFLRKSPPPLLKQLADLKQIQHLTLDHVHHNEQSLERIQTYFTALSSTLRSFELFPTIRCGSLGNSFYEWNPDVIYVNQWLSNIHLLTNLEELRLSFGGNGSFDLEQLPKLSKFHTFICRNNPPYAKSRPSLQHLASCQQLKHCSWGRYALGSPVGVQDVKEFIFARQGARNLDLSSEVGGAGSEMDPMEFFDLSTIAVKSELFGMVTAAFPNLKTLKAQWELAPHDWSALRSFKQLTHLSIVMGQREIQVNDFLNDLIQCRTIETLMLGDMTSPLTEIHLRSILSHLPELTDLTLSSMILNSVAGFSELNQLRRLVLNYCRSYGRHKPKWNASKGAMNFPLATPDALNIRATLPSIPTLTHLTLLEPTSSSHPKPSAPEILTSTKELFARMPLLGIGRFVEKTYRRTDLELSVPVLAS